MQPAAHPGTVPARLQLRPARIFFIAGLLYLLHFERVDDLGAYSIPSGTGLLIPSDYNGYFRVAR
jgi:hypothetical protein